MTDHELVIDTYLAAYGEPDTTKRAELVADAFAVDATLADPPFSATGHVELSASFAEVQAQFPQHRFTRTSAVDHHHGTARFTWSLDASDGSTAVAGTDFVRFGPEGKIESVAGFFGDLEPTA